MKKIIFSILAVAVLAAGAIFVVAQIKAHASGRGFGPGRGPMAGKILSDLNLTDDQKARVKGIFEANQSDISAVRSSLKANHEKMNAATANGAFDQAQVTAIATQQGNLIAQMIVERQKVRSQVFAILTDEQKAKATDMRSKFEEQMKARREMPGKPEGSEF